MKISDLGEFGLIGRIQKLAPRKSSSTLIGIGDDAAALKLSASHTLLATTDLLLEGVHFDLAYTDFYSLGWKSAAANLSDIAAMGGVPRYCLTALGIPQRTTAEQVTEFYRGCNALLKRHAAELVGGDTCSSRTGLFSSVTAVGETAAARVVTVSPDVSSSTNLGGWVNKVGVWSAAERTDWFADDAETILHWREKPTGQHIELGIAETNSVSLAAGLATCGYLPYIYSMAPFGVIKCAEQLRTDIAYHHLPVRLVGRLSGLAMGFFGTSRSPTAGGCTCAAGLMSPWPATGWA